MPKNIQLETGQDEIKTPQGGSKALNCQINCHSKYHSSPLWKQRTSRQRKTSISWLLTSPYSLPPNTIHHKTQHSSTFLYLFFFLLRAAGSSSSLYSLGILAKKRNSRIAKYCHSPRNPKKYPWGLKKSLEYWPKQKLSVLIRQRSMSIFVGESFSNFRKHHNHLKDY